MVLEGGSNLVYGMELNDYKSIRVTASTHPCPISNSIELKKLVYIV